MSVALIMYCFIGGHLFSAEPHGLSIAAESQGNCPCTQSGTHRSGDVSVNQVDTFQSYCTIPIACNIPPQH